MSPQRIIHQPLHPSILSKLDPEYVDFHNTHLQYIKPSETFKWDPAVRNVPSMPPGGSAPEEVGNIRDIELPNCRIRAFTPEGTTPERGWPVCIWFHGGGWTLGDINSENNICSVLCKQASCVVINVDYRLAPEHPFPAAVDDAVEVLEWLISDGEMELGINKSQIAVGGSSAGGNLAATLTLKAASASPPIPLVFQLLVVPVIDNTATAGTVWAVNRNAPWLTPARMTWYRRMYMPNEDDWSLWSASPNLAPLELIAESPKTWIGVAELDILAPEGVAYGELLRKAGVEVGIKVYEGSTHSILALDGNILCIGKQLVADATRELTMAFSTS